MRRALVGGIVAALAIGSIAAIVFLRGDREDEYSRYPHYPFYVSISADGNYLTAGYVGTENAFVQLFSRADNAPLQTYLTPSWMSTSISSSGDYIAVGTTDNLYFFTKSNDEPLWSTSIVTGTKAEISSDGTFILGFRNFWPRRLYLFSKENNSPLWSYEFPAGGGIEATMSLDGVHVVASFEGQLYIFGRDDNVPGLLDLPTVGSLSISANGNYIAGGGGSEVYLFSRVENALLWSCKGLINNIGNVVISADGNYIAVDEGAISYWDIFYPEGSQAGLHLFAREDNIPRWSYRTPTGWDGNASTSISDNGNYIAVGDMRKLYLFGDADNIPLWTYEFPEHVSVESVSISSDGNFIAVGTEGGPAPNIGGSVYLFDKDGNIVWSYHHEVKPYSIM